MGNFRQAVLNSIFPANPVKDVLKCRSILLAIGELNAIICKDRMDAIGQIGDEVAQELAAIILPDRSCNSM